MSETRFLFITTVSANRFAVVSVPATALPFITLPHMICRLLPYRPGGFPFNNFKRKRPAGFYHSICRRTFFFLELLKYLYRTQFCLKIVTVPTPEKTHGFETFLVLYQVYSFVLAVASHSAKAVVVQERSVSGAKLRGDPRVETVDGMVV